MRVTPVLAIIALAATPLAAMPAAASPVDGLSGDPLERGATLALPSVYRLTVTVRLRELRTRDGRRVALPPGARELPALGTAFGVAPGGWIVSSAHVAAPGGASLAADAYQAKLGLARRPHSDAAARRWVQRTGARPAGVRVVSRTLRQADAGAGARASRAYRPTDISVDRASDLALMRIPERRAPSLALDESVSIGTPVATIGFGTASAFARPERGMLEPALRRGTLGRTGLLRDPTDATGGGRRRAVQVTNDVLPGDSGGPAVDGRGRVRGVVVKYNDEGGVIERGSEVRGLLRRAGVQPGPDATSTAFHEALDRYWALDLNGAQQGFRRTLARFPGHTLAPVLLDRTERIEAGRPRLSAGGGRRRAFLLALAGASAAGAAACGIALARTGGGRGGGPAAGSPPRLGARRRR